MDTAIWTKVLAAPAITGDSKPKAANGMPITL